MQNILKYLTAKKRLALTPGNLCRPLALLDIGARDGIQWPWDRIAQDQLNLILVEPDPVEADRLKKACVRDGRGFVIPSVLWRDERTLHLNLNLKPGTSSVFPANRSLLDQFPDSDRYSRVSTIDLPAQTIDQLAATGQLHHIDFAKIDVQGAELAILEGGAHFFARNLIGLEVEVEFCELYIGQPLFAEVDAYARSLGLELWDLRKTYWKYEQGMHVPGPVKGRLVFGDALYFRPLTGLASWLSSMADSAATEKIVMLVTSALAYGYADYAEAVVNEPSLGRYLNAEILKELKQSIRSLGAGFRPFRNGNRYLFTIFNLLARAFQPTFGSWASSGRDLGSHRRGPFWC